MSSDRATRARAAARRVAALARPRVAAALVAQGRDRAASDGEHLDAAMAWLVRAQAATGNGGVSARYDLASGWERAYPETTGYIIGTFLHYAALTGAPAPDLHAVRMGEWLLTLQNPEGWIAGGFARDRGPGRPEVFNTGQVLFGWLALHEVTGREDFAEAAVRAARWIVSVQSDDGSWVTASLHGVPHSYYSRVSWAVARAGSVLGDAALSASAQRSVDWVCAQQSDDGWIDHMSFTPGSPALTHTIAYTVEGLLECALVLDHEHAWDVAVTATRALDAQFRRTEIPSRPWRAGGLPATFGPGWRAVDTSSVCVTGSAQTALCARRIDRFAPEPALAELADDLTRSVKRAHPLTGSDGVRGGVPGSDPIWGSYASFKYLNWATKFVADLLLDRVGGSLPRSRFG